VRRSRTNFQQQKHFSIDAKSHSMQKATRQQTKEQNRNLVLKIFFERSSISRAEIARMTHLTRTTVSDIVADLMAEGLVAEIGLGSSTGGKSPILVSLVDNSRYFIGIDLAYNMFCGAIINLRNQISNMVCLPANGMDGEKSLKAIFEILDPLTRSDCQPILGIGVGTPGLVNSREGIVVNAVNLGWYDLPLARILEDRYHLPVFLLNDCQAAAMGEFIYGQSPPASPNMIVVRAGHGIGSGIIINGQLFQGDGGAAGEIGHVVVVHEDGLPCRCGNSGCLETVASARAVVQQAQCLVENTSYTITGGNDPHEVTLETLEKAVANGDEAALQIIVQAGKYLGLAVASLVGMLNIHDVVLMGEMTRFGDPWLDAIRETVAKTALSRLARDATIHIGSLRENGVILGAAASMASDYSLLFGSTHSIVEQTH
jgi:N-acetylglucosamine repressor